MDQERYKRICGQITYFAERMDKVFNRFVQLSIATIGGFTWLKTQPLATAADNVFPMVRWIIPFLALVTVVEILSDLKSWLGYRRAEADLLGLQDLVPRFPISGRLQGFQIITAVAVAVAGFIYLQ